MVARGITLSAFMMYYGEWDVEEYVCYREYMCGLVGWHIVLARRFVSLEERMQCLLRKVE